MMIDCVFTMEGKKKCGYVVGFIDTYDNEAEKCIPHAIIMYGRDLLSVPFRNVSITGYELK